jgi:hypothetical protein
MLTDHLEISQRNEGSGLQTFNKVLLIIFVALGSIIFLFYAASWVANCWECLERRKKKQEAAKLGGINRSGVVGV